MLYHKSHLSDLPSVSQITHVQSPMSAFKTEHSIFFPEIITGPGDSCSNARGVPRLVPSLAAAARRSRTGSDGAGDTGTLLPAGQGNAKTAGNFCPIKPQRCAHEGPAGPAQPPGTSPGHGQAQMLGLKAEGPRSTWLCSPGAPAARAWGAQHGAPTPQRERLWLGACAVDAQPSTKGFFWGLTPAQLPGKAPARCSSASRAGGAGWQPRRGVTRRSVPAQKPAQLPFRMRTRV